MKIIFATLLILLFDSCLKDAETEIKLYDKYISKKYEKTVVFFTDMSNIEVYLPESNFSFEVFGLKDNAIFSLKKNDEVFFSSQVVRTHFVTHCEGSDCYYTYEYITTVPDSFHLLHVDGYLELLKEYPLNLENIDSYLPANQSAENILSLWNYYR